ncbi:MAG: hypothetical protein AB1480_14790 [Nitrospirota bacterium]
MDIGGSISVIASFGPPYKIRPVRFKWNGRLFEVKEITYSWQTKEGQKKKYHFSVTDGKTLYELSFDTNSLLWRMEKLEV